MSFLPKDPISKGPVYYFQLTKNLSKYNKYLKKSLSISEIKLTKTLKINKEAQENLKRIQSTSKKDLWHLLNEAFIKTNLYISQPTSVQKTNGRLNYFPAEKIKKKEKSPTQVLTKLKSIQISKKNEEENSLELIKNKSVNLSIKKEVLQNKKQTMIRFMQKKLNNASQICLNKFEFKLGSKASLFSIKNYADEFRTVTIHSKNFCDFFQKKKLPKNKVGCCVIFHWKIIRKFPKNSVLFLAGELITEKTKIRFKARSELVKVSKLSLNLTSNSAKKRTRGSSCLKSYNALTRGGNSSLPRESYNKKWIELINKLLKTENLEKVS